MKKITNNHDIYFIADEVIQYDNKISCIKDGYTQLVIYDAELTDFIIEDITE